MAVIGRHDGVAAYGDPAAKKSGEWRFARGRSAIGPENELAA
jgi:hypothetical protein